MILLIGLILVLICAYNKGYVTKYYYSVEKYDAMKKKYKDALNNCANELDEAHLYIEAQNAILAEMKQQQSQTSVVHNVGTTNSSHSAALTPAKFVSSKDPEIIQHAANI